MGSKDDAGWVYCPSCQWCIPVFEEPGLTYKVGHCDDCNKTYFIVSDSEVIVRIEGERRYSTHMGYMILNPGYHH